MLRHFRHAVSAAILPAAADAQFRHFRRADIFDFFSFATFS